MPQACRNYMVAGGFVAAIVLSVFAEPPRKEGSLRKDLYGDSLPPGAVARLGTLRLYHEDGHRIAYSADGKILASAGDGNVILWNATTGTELRQFSGDRCFALSPDGTRVASSRRLDFERAEVLVWDTINGKELHRLPGHRDEVFALAFSPDSKLLATGSFDGTIRIWDAVGGKQVALLTKIQGRIFELAFSPDGKTLISGEEHMTPGEEGRRHFSRVWEVASRKERKRFDGQQFQTLSPDGQVMAMTNNKQHTLKLMSWGTGDTILTLKHFPAEGRFPGDVHSASITPDGKTLATVCSFDSAIRLWNTRTGEIVRTIPLPGYAFSVAFAPDGKTLAVGVPWAPGHNRLRLFDPATGSERILQRGHQDLIQDVRFLSGGRTIATISVDKTLRRWQTVDGKETDIFSFSKIPVAVAADGSLVAACGDTKFNSSSEETVDLWDTSTRKIKHQLAGHRSGVYLVAFTANSATLAVSTFDGEVYLWDTTTGKLRKHWSASSDGLRATVQALAFSSDGSVLATGNWDCTVDLWEARSGKLIRQLGKAVDLGHNRARVSGASSIAFAPDGKSLAAALLSENSIHLWDVASGRELCQFRGHPEGWRNGWVYALCFSGDGKTLFSGSQDRSIRLWDVRSGTEYLSLQGHRGGVRALALSPDGTRLASGSQDCTILIWDLVSLKTER
jgi:WD40 repeat protein